MSKRLSKPVWLIILSSYFINL